MANVSVKSLIGQASEQIAVAITGAVAEHRLETVRALAEKWQRHRHQAEHSGSDDTFFQMGMMRAYAECIRLELGTDLPLAEIEKELRAGRVW